MFIFTECLYHLDQAKLVCSMAVSIVALLPKGLPWALKLECILWPRISVYYVLHGSVSFAH